MNLPGTPRNEKFPFIAKELGKSSSETGASLEELLALEDCDLKQFRFCIHLEWTSVLLVTDIPNTGIFRIFQRCSGRGFHISDLLNCPVARILNILPTSSIEIRIEPHWKVQVSIW